MRRKFYLIFIFLLIHFYTASAQTWRSELYPANWKPPFEANFYTDKIIQDYSFAGYRRGEKQVPNITSNIIDVTKAPYLVDNTGKKDVTVLLQKALEDVGAKGGGVIYLPPGTYLVSSTEKNNHCLLIDRSGVILRGAGIGKTFLLNSSDQMRSKSIIKIETGKSWSATGDNQTAITKDLMHPTNTIPVENTAGFKVGDLVIVRNYINNDWIAKHKMLEYWKDKGNHLNGQMYCREITAINTNKNEILLDIPIRYALETAHNAVVYKAPAMLTEVGVEELSIGNKQNSTPGDWTEESYNQPTNGSYQCHDSFVIAMAQVHNGWIKNVASYQPAGNTSQAHILSNGIKLSQTKNVSILNCDFKKPQFGGGGGNGYMYRIMGNETLIQNCVAEFNRHGFVLSHTMASGNVFRQCIDKDSGLQTGLTGNEKTSGSGSDHHMHFSHSNLFDQCTVENSFFAAGWRKWGGSTNHGLTAAHSVYWNLKSNGSQPQAVQTQQGRYGYVIGTSGNKPTVKTAAWHPGTEKITDPIDFLEGLGKAETLNPQSLYQDQLSKRLGKANMRAVKK